MFKSSKFCMRFNSQKIGTAIIKDIGEKQVKEFVKRK